MRTVVEPLEGNKVKLSIEVDEQEFEHSIDAAFRKIAREVRIPGFRPGRAPRRILEARLGAGTGRAEALRESLPDYYARALRESEVDAIAPPAIDITAGEESGAVSFDAVVEVRPQLTLSGYEGLTVTVPSPEVTDEDVRAQVDRLRSNSGVLEPVERPARSGDHLTIDIKATQDGAPVAALTTDDFLYELGSGSVLPELDTELLDARVGDTVTFDASFGDGADADDTDAEDTGAEDTGAEDTGAEDTDAEDTGAEDTGAEDTGAEDTGAARAEVDRGKVRLEVLVKDVKEQVLPEVTDEWAAEASEFDTVDALRADIVERMTMVKRMQATLGMRNGVVEAVVALVDVDPPEPLVSAEIERRAHDLGHRLEQQGATIAQYLQATGQSEDQVVSELRAGAVPAVKADLALRAIAEAESLEPTGPEIDAEIERLAVAYEVTAAELRANLERAEQMRRCARI